MHSVTPDSTQIVKAASALGMLGGGRHAAHRLLAALCEGNLGLREVIALVERDPGLTARVLKVANSSFYGRAREVDSLPRAVSLLGLDAVRGIAAAACLDRVLPAGPAAPLPDIDRLVQHSLATALAAEQFARMHLPALATDAFIAGLLHDLGAVIQARVDPQGFRRLIDAVRAEPSERLLDIELRCVSVSHEQCARVVFGHWQLPEALLEAACHHHRPMDAPPDHRALASLVHLGNCASVLAGQSFCAESTPGACDIEALSIAGVDADVLRITANELGERVSQFLARLR